MPEVDVAGKQNEEQAPTQDDQGPPAMPGKARSDINDVARLANVSRQTVSNVLNNRTGYSEDTRNRVLRAIEELDYQPHRAARSLRSQRTMQLGYHMPGEQLAAENAFVLGFIQALVRAAAHRGHHVLVFTERDDELEVFRELVAIRGVDGFVLSGSRIDDARARFLHQAGVPFAMFGRTAPGLPQTWVDTDGVAATAAVVDYLAERGHEAFAYVGYEAKNYWDVERLEGFRKGLADNGLRVPESAIVQGATLETARAGVLRLLARKRRPTAIVTGSGGCERGQVHRAARRPGRGRDRLRRRLRAADDRADPDQRAHPRRPHRRRADRPLPARDRPRPDQRARPGRPHRARGRRQRLAERPRAGRSPSGPRHAPSAAYRATSSTSGWGARAS
jgi:DNA-binding LacI/PurR family transcriptional regulator